MRRLNVGLLFMLIVCTTKGQVIEKPNYSMKSPHETLEIRKVENTEKELIVYFTIENRIPVGTFCADKNIYIIKPNGTKLLLRQSKGIPVCPNGYKFRFIGERLDFSLTFPPLDKEIKWFDLIEDCSDNCFWFYGVTVDQQLNERLNGAFISAESGTPDTNIKIFSDILKEIDSDNLGVEGLLYINIINAARENSDKVTEQVYFKRLSESGAPRVSEYIRYLESTGNK
jgi:hypothetical protein